MINIHTPLQNNLLKNIAKADFDQLEPYLEFVEMPKGQILCESGSVVTHVYFPTTALVSILYESQDGNSVEVALVGNEGMLGIASFMGGDSMPRTLVVQNAGYGYRLKAPIIKQAFNSSGTLCQVLLRHIQALVTQMAQTVICNRHHCIEQQLCRFLLLCIDRLPNNSINMTQEQISHLIGVRREGITEAACKLHKAGLITYSRGNIRVLDREGLEENACECYQVVKSEVERLFPENKKQLIKPIKELAYI